MSSEELEILNILDPVLKEAQDTIDKLAGKSHAVQEVDDSLFEGESTILANQLSKEKKGPEDELTTVC